MASKWREMTRMTLEKRDFMRKATASLHQTEPWKCNEGKSRTIEEAVEIAKLCGVEIPECIEFNVYKKAVPQGAHASYGIGDRPEHALVQWEEFELSQQGAYASSPLCFAERRGNCCGYSTRILRDP